jgi:hypothetical protein
VQFGHIILSGLNVMMVFMYGVSRKCCKMKGSSVLDVRVRTFTYLFNLQLVNDTTYMLLANLSPSYSLSLNISHIIIENQLKRIIHFSSN